MSEDENKIIEFMKNNPYSCVKCFMWDLTVQKFGRHGICGDCFDKNYVELKNPYWK